MQPLHVVGLLALIAGTITSIWLAVYGYISYHDARSNARSGLHSDATRLVQRSPKLPVHNGPPFCSQTGAGFCNLTFWNSTVFDTAFIYNRYCNEIGFNLDLGTGKFEIDSQLPYVVVGNAATQTFCYSGQCYGKDCIYYFADGTKTSIVKQCAFNC